MIANDTSSGDRFGRRVKICDPYDLIFVGEFVSDTIYIYQYDNNYHFNLIQKISNDSIGWQFAISPNCEFMIASTATNIEKFYQLTLENGKIYYNETGTISGHDSIIADEFGFCMEMSNNYAILLCFVFFVLALLLVYICILNLSFFVVCFWLLFDFVCKN